MRWALFPALAAIAGAVGGAAAHGGSNLRLPTIVAALSAGAALASMLTTRLWLGLLIAPAIGLMTGVGGMAFSLAYERGTAVNPRDVIDLLTRSPDAIALISAVALAQTAVHGIALRKSWAVALGAALGAALVCFLLAALLNSRSVAVFLAASILAQVPAVLAARAVARRLRPPEAA